MFIASTTCLLIATFFLETPDAYVHIADISRFPVRRFDGTLLAETEGLVVKKQWPPISPGGDSQRQGRASNKFEQFGATCWLCCTLKMNTSICKDQSICQRASCLKYVVKTGTLRTSMTVPIDRGARRLELSDGTAPNHDENQLCKRHHSDMNPVKAIAGLLEPCTYHCVGGPQMELFTHTKSNGQPCLQDKVCWDGQCLEKADGGDYEICKRIFGGRDVRPIVKLPCQVTCRTMDDGQIWSYPREHTANCDPPAWLPKKIQDESPHH